MELNPEQFGFTISKSPLDYSGNAPSFGGGGYHPKRMEILHPDLPPAPKTDQDHVTGYTRTHRRSPSTGRLYKKPKEEQIPGAHPKAAGFIDYSETTHGPFIHFMETRQDLQGHGVGRQMVDKFYEHHRDAQEVDWGRILHPAAEHMFMDRREKQDEPGYQGPRSYGKTY